MALSSFSQNPAFPQGFFWVFALGVLLCSSCSEISPAAKIAPPLEKKSPLQKSDPTYHGLSKKQAFAKIKAQDLIPRVIREDGNHFIITKDYRRNRINLIIKNGIVIGTTRG